MKRNLVTATTLIALAGLVLASDAEAGRRKDNRKLSEKRTEMPALYTDPHHFDRDPTMSFVRGVLRRDGLAGWKVGDFNLQMGPQANVLGPDGQSTMLQEGRDVLVMGPRFGDTYIGWSVRLLEPERPGLGATQGVVKKPSDATADVGEIVQAPQ
jgi:hypothetical protein